MHRKRILSLSCLLIALAMGAFALNGCERKEKILDIETPHGEVEVERSLDSGQVDVDVNRE